MLRRHVIGYGVIILYMLVPYLLLLTNTIEPVIFGIPYAMWSQILYGVLAVPILYFVFKLVWPNIPEDLEELE